MTGTSNGNVPALYPRQRIDLGGLDMSSRTRNGPVSEVRHVYLEAAAAHGHDSAEALVAWWQWHEMLRRGRPRGRDVRY